MSSFNHRRLLMTLVGPPEPPQVVLANSRAGSVEELEDQYRQFSSSTDAIAESRRGDLAVLTALGEKTYGRRQFDNAVPGKKVVVRYFDELAHVGEAPQQPAHL